jgi:hypothetical protein
MDEHLSIRRAARAHDWGACARIMFWQLFSRTFEEQKRITKDVLLVYLNIWNDKHPAIYLPPKEFHLDDDLVSKMELCEKIDAADNEFCNALIEYAEGMSNNNRSIERVKHFATSIRSSVLAIQINRWIRNFPEQYERWKAGKLVSGPTFLDDKLAADDAEKAWEHIDLLFSHTAQGQATPEMPMNKIETAYREWERSLL